MEQRIIVNRIKFNLAEVLLKETKDKWLEWAMLRFYDGHNEMQKRRYLTEVWEQAEAYALSINPPAEPAKAEEAPEEEPGSDEKPPRRSRKSN